MPIHKIQRELRANKPKLICSALHCAVWEIIVIKAFNCNTLLTFSALPKVKLNAMLFLYCLWCQYYACWTNKHNPRKMKPSTATSWCATPSKWRWWICTCTTLAIGTVCFFQEIEKKSGGIAAIFRWNFLNWVSASIMHHIARPADTLQDRGGFRAGEIL